MTLQEEIALLETRGLGFDYQLCELILRIVRKHNIFMDAAINCKSASLKDRLGVEKAVGDEINRLQKYVESK